MYMYIYTHMRGELRQECKKYENHILCMIQIYMCMVKHNVFLPFSFPFQGMSVCVFNSVWAYFTQ